MLPDRHLQLLALGTALAAFDLPVDLGPLPLTLPLQVAGVVMIAVALWGLRPADKPLERRATRDLTASAGLVVLWGLLLTLQLLSHARGGLIGPLSQLVLLVPFVLTARVMERFAVRGAWSYAARAWRRTLYLAAVCYGSALAVYLAFWTTGLAAGVSLDPGSHPVLGLIGPLWLATPVVALLVAVGRTSRDQAQLEGEPLTPLAQAVHARWVPAVALLVLVAPHWAIEIPRQLHHLLTPGFTEYVRDHRAVSSTPALPEGCKPVAYWTGPTWRHGVVAPLTATNDPLPAGLRSQAYRLRLELRHGDERLLGLEQEVLATVDVDAGTLDGVRVRTIRATADPAFRLVLHARVDLDAPTEAAAEGAAHRIPFQLHVELLAGRGSLIAGGERVKGLTTPDPDAAWTEPHDAGLLHLRGGPIAGRLPTDGGLRYAVTVDGALTFRSNGELVLDVPTRTRFVPDATEYSYELTIDEQLVQQDQHPPQTRRKGPATLVHRRSWRGMEW